MAQNTKVDIVTVGGGLVAGIMAYELTRAGLQVVSLEQEPWLTTENDFSHDHDELRYNQRREMMVDLSRETWTWRPSPKDRALPMRQYGSFNPHQGVGGGGPLGDPELAVLPLRFRVPRPSHRALRPGQAADRQPHPGLGHHLGRDRAVLRRVGV